MRVEASNRFKDFLCLLETKPSDGLSGRLLSLKVHEHRSQKPLNSIFVNGLAIESHVLTAR